MNILESMPIPIELQEFALQVAIGGLCVSAMVLAVARLMRRRSEPLRYGILLTGIIGLLAVPALVGAGRSCQLTLPWFAAAVDDEVMKVPAEMLHELLDRPAADPLPADSPSMVVEAVGAALLAIWVLGAIVGMGRLLHALWKQSRALAGAPWRPGFWTDERQTLLAGKLGLRRFPSVHLSPVVPMPMVIGIWRPTIVLPEPAPTTWEQPQWEAVLLHEAAHIARGDQWAALAQRIAVVLFWWCPLVYLLARRLNDLRENICDDCALQGSCDRLAYAELLVESAEHFLSLTAIPASLGLMNSARGGLEARVTRLLAKESPTMTRLSLSGKLLGAAFLMTACLLTTAGTAISGGQPPPQKKIQIKIIVDGKEIDLGDVELSVLFCESLGKSFARAGLDVHVNEHGVHDVAVPQNNPSSVSIVAEQRLSFGQETVSVCEVLFRTQQVVFAGSIGFCSMATCSSSSLGTTTNLSGASRMLDWRCGRSGRLSPLHALVPYTFVSREALATDTSTFTASSLNSADRALRTPSISLVEASSLGRSMA